MRHIVSIFFFMFASVLIDAQAVDRVDLEGTSIIGNRELPKVLYIVPWKKADVENLMGNPVANLVDEALGPVDREVFRREVQYYDSIKGDLKTDPASKE
ncbi:MAG: hypothetical protein ACE5NW_06590 [Acidiferrobacterales bacterium]